MPITPARRTASRSSRNSSSVSAIGFSTIMCLPAWATAPPAVGGGSGQPGERRDGAGVAPPACGRLRGRAAVAAVLAVFGAAALAFAWPWAVVRPVGGALLARYSPQPAASALLLVRY